jgi:hypothetical protein
MAETPVAGERSAPPPPKPSAPRRPKASPPRAPGADADFIEPDEVNPNDPND